MPPPVPFTVKPFAPRSVVCLLAMAAAPVLAQPTAASGLAACLGISEDAERLTCYDREAGREAMFALPTPRAADTAPSRQAAARDETTVPTLPGQSASGSLLSGYWELDRDDKRGTFNYTSFRPNYLLPARVIKSVNRTPYSSTRGTSTGLPDYQNAETKLQISLRSKILEDFLLPGADVWVAYTQQSYWQLFNSEESSPFRNTDYQPEVVYVMPVPARLQALPLGWSWRMAQVGWVHQSNGQTGSLSRSWNRLYAGAGVERGDVVGMVRLEQRIESDQGHRDDNPDISAYLGRFETQLLWSPGRSTVSMTWRPAEARRGSLQLDWTYPVDKSRPDALRWYAQVFHGFGETLLDYNFRQSSLGFGLTIFKF